MTKNNALPKVPLGRTGMDVTRIGVGAWAMGGGSWGPQDDKDSIAAIHHAVELGINWIDTAAIYGFGHSEEVVGRALAEIPASERPFVFTKAGLVWDEKDPKATIKDSGDTKLIRRDVEISLKRLRVERIDLYQMHWPAKDGTPLDEYWGTFQDLKREGKIRAAGLSNHDVPMLEAAEKVGHVDTLQPPFSMIRREAGAAEIPWCHAHETGVIIYSPMQAGLLTGTFTKERVAALPEGDWRLNSNNFQGDALEKNLALAETLRPIAARHGTTVATIALSWTLAWPGITGAIVGARSPAQVDGWIDAASLRLNEADLQEIAGAIERTGAGAGPMRP